MTIVLVTVGIFSGRDLGHADERADELGPRALAPIRALAVLEVEPRWDESQDLIPREAQGLVEDLPDEVRARDFGHKGAR
jgi:hypothetical protein